MSVELICVDTNSRKERKVLFDFLHEKNIKTMSLDDYNGFSLIGIDLNGAANLGVIIAWHMSKDDKLKHYFKVKDFINDYDNAYEIMKKAKETEVILDVVNMSEIDEVKNGINEPVIVYGHKG